MSIRGKQYPHERCASRPIAGTDWCGKHKATQVRFLTPILIESKENEIQLLSPRSLRSEDPVDIMMAANTIRRSWQLWQSRKAGPLLHFKEESNNPFDFFSSDPIAEIPRRDFVSFVDAGKGYIMDIKSVSSLLDHAKKNNELPLNPFNRSPLTAVFLRRLARRKKDKIVLWSGLEATSDSQKVALATTDLFRALEDLGNYTDPAWFSDLSRFQLQQLYIELADIWYHRATLSAADRARIVPVRVFRLPVTTVLVMPTKGLRPLLLETCTLLVSSAAAKSDRQLGGMYVLGSLAIIHEPVSVAFPWLVEMFSPGATRIIGGQLRVSHPSVLAY